MVKSTLTRLILDFSVNLLSWSQVWLLCQGWFRQCCPWHWLPYWIGWWWPLQSCCPPLQGGGDTEADPCQCWYHAEFFIHQSSSIHFSITVVARNAQRGSSENHSNYAVCAVNPSRVLTTFSDAALREVVNNVATRTMSLLIIMLMYVLTFQPHPFWFLMHLQGLRDMSAPENSSLCRLWQMFWTIWKSKRLILQK